MCQKIEKCKDAVTSNGIPSLPSFIAIWLQIQNYFALGGGGGGGPTSVKNERKKRRRNNLLKTERKIK
jgi:hypothetical protein